MGNAKLLTSYLYGVLRQSFIPQVWHEPLLPGYALFYDAEGRIEVEEPFLYQSG
jgi:hypothetical protein